MTPRFSLPVVEVGVEMVVVGGGGAVVAFVVAVVERDGGN